jgi:hypothetical protein
LNTTHAIEEYLNHCLINKELEQAALYFQKLCSIPQEKCANLSLKEILSWAENMQGENLKLWKKYSSTNWKSFPYNFPYFVYSHQQNAIIESRKYPRLQNIDYQLIRFEDDLIYLVESLDPADGARFIGELAGAWVLSIPSQEIYKWLLIAEEEGRLENSNYRYLLTNYPINEDDYILFMNCMLFTSWEEFWAESIMILGLKN